MSHPRIDFCRRAAPVALLVTLAACGIKPDVAVPDSGPDTTGMKVVIASFTATPNTLTKAAEVTLTWSVTGATTVHIEPDLGDVTGTSVTTKIYAPTTFVLAASNGSDSQTASTTVAMRLPTFIATVDAAVKPQVAQLSATRQLGASADAVNVVSDFVIDEVRFRPRNQGELDAFVARVHGTVVDTDAVPAAPPELGLDAAKPAEEYVIHFDSTGTSLQTLSADAASDGIGGAMRFSSQKSLEFFAAVTHERAAGLKLSPNTVMYGSSVLFHTQEKPNGPGKWLDTFDPDQFPRFQSRKRGSSLVEAWQWMQGHGIARMVRVAIIDGGFWVDGSGNLMTPPGEPTELGPPVPQFNFNQHDYVDTVVDGENPMSCTGGAPCPWHGTGSASVAVGRVNNRGGAAGSGGFVATPMLFAVDGSASEIHKAVRTSINWQADVINLSMGTACNYWCRIYDRIFDDYENAEAAGIVVVASAGNDNVTVDDDNFYHPCIEDAVICVGSVNDEADTKASYSNYGQGVDIWAPTDLWSASNGTSPTANVLFNGTSASSPFVAGIVAMMKAVDPTLHSEQVRQILFDTSWKGTTPDSVSGVVNALAAVRRVSNGRLPDDRFEVGGGVTPLPSGTYDDLTIATPTDTDHYTFTLGASSMVTLDLAYPRGIGNLSMIGGGLSGTYTCGVSVLKSDTFPTTGRSMLYQLPQGTYSFGVSSVGALPYDLKLNAVASPTSLPPDSYEPNDTFATAYALGNLGVVRASLRNNLDVDWYVVYSRGSYTNSVLNISTTAEILSADAPITLRSYDVTGQLLGTSTAGGDCSSPASITLPAGVVKVSVSGTVPANYVMSIGGKITSRQVYVDTDFYEFVTHPGDPISFEMRNPGVAYLINNQTDYDSQALQIYTPNIHAKVLAVDGTLLAEGTRVDFQGTVGESVATPRPTANGSFIVTLLRVDDLGAPVTSNIAVDVNMVLTR